MTQPGESRSTEDAAVDPCSAGTVAHTLAPVSGDAAQTSSVPPGSCHVPRRLAGRKRRRTTKACDDCRRKKIKCDGKQPCSSCADFNSGCTYARLSERERGTRQRGAHEKGAEPNDPDVLEKRLHVAEPNGPDVLEKRLHVAESLLRKFLPHIDLESPDAAASPPLPQKSPPTPRAHGGAEGLAAPGAGAAAAAASSRSPGSGTVLPALGERAGQLDLTETGEYDFHGMSSGAAFLSRITQHFPGLLRYDSRMPFLPQPQRPFLAKPLGLPAYSANPWWQENHDFLRLPPRQLAYDLCEYSFSRASCLLRVVHAPSFWKMFERLYEERPQRYTAEERRFVGLLFSVMALGSMYDVDENDPTNPDHYTVATERGYNYYISARHFLQDITECCDMTTLQALVFIIQFLQATGNLNGCHTFVGIALRSALRMGLHRHLPHASIAPIKDQTRRRVFHTIRQMDIYLSTTLGLPLLLQDRDIDQPLPTEVDDEYITEGGIQRPPPGTPSFLEAFNAHARLMRMLAKVVDCLYPPTGTDEGPLDVTYMISFAEIKKIEKDLHDWHGHLSPAWRPGPEPEGNPQIVRVKILLRFAYAHVQMMLYRPFLQYYSHQVSTDETVDERYFALATAGINVCRNIIHIGLEIQKQAVLIGPYWFITYTQFFAVLTLLLYILNNPDQPGASDLFADAKLGKDCISGLTQRSLAADRVTVALNSLFDQLPDRLKSTDSQIRDGNLGSTSNTEQAHLRYRLDGAPERQPPPNVLGPRRQWRLDSFSAPGGQALGSRIEGLRPEATMQSHAHTLRPGQSHSPANVMDFPIEDPFAYPLLPGVSLADNDFATLREDVLRLPLYNTHLDIDEQFLHFPDLQYLSSQPSTSTNPPLYPPPMHFPGV